MAVILDVRNLSKTFGGLVAIDDLSLQVDKGTIHAIIGPNGSGKTTFFNLVTGMYAPDGGEILFDGEPVNGLLPHAIARKGIGRTFQNLLLFGDMTAVDNVMVGLQCRNGYSLMEAILRRGAGATDKMYSEAARLLDFVRMGGARDQPSRYLSYGDQRLLEIARALGTSPRLVLLDEPAAGMNPQETGVLMSTIRRIRDELGTTVILIEHDMKLVMNLAERVSVLNYGRLVSEGTPEQVRNDPKVIEAYLGVAEEQ
ncbi:MAG: ABC transporter ATP-binding protein [Firmicutes bacterium]|jgi:branched-chain amino acid transport system ATP-binding protein|nr:ABC transporter ATP-binding protein [Bacillota bacterium]MDH7494777.1 ABC transporter ATP-binding protein [Bacillota bacterium]